MAEPPRIEFPCRYPIKVIVEMSHDVIRQIVEIISVHDMHISPDEVSQNPSRTGKYVSIRYEMWATGQSQIEALFRDLKKCDAVRVVL